MITILFSLYRIKILCLEDRRKKLSKKKLHETPQNLQTIDSYICETMCLFDLSVNDVQRKFLSTNKSLKKKDNSL